MEESANKVEEEVARVLEHARELQDSGASLVSRISNEEQSLRQKANSLDSSIRRLRSLINSLLSQKLLEPRLADKASTHLACFLFFFLISFINSSLLLLRSMKSYQKFLQFGFEPARRGFAESQMHCKRWRRSCFSSCQSSGYNHFLFKTLKVDSFVPVFRFI